jgi:hypothetical protein
MITILYENITQGKIGCGSKLSKKFTPGCRLGKIDPALLRTLSQAKIRACGIRKCSLPKREGLSPVSNPSDEKNTVHCFLERSLVLKAQENKVLHFIPDAC